MNKNKNVFLNGLIDLAQSRLGSKIVYKTDEFFAPAKRIINPWPPIFKEGVFDKHGKWMDGWETRRKRVKGHDYLILKLGRPGKIYKVNIWPVISLINIEKETKLIFTANKISSILIKITMIFFLLRNIPTTPIVKIIAPRIR